MKKLCSTVLAAAVILQGFGAASFSVSAADAIDQNTAKVIYQSSFSDYANNAAMTQPQGFVKAIADHEGTWNDASYTRFRPWQEEDGDTSVLNGNYKPQGNDTGYLYNRNGAFDVIPFGEVINSGKLHISMDFIRPDKKFDPTGGLYTTDDITGGRFMVTLFNTDTNDYTTPNGKVYKASGTDVGKFYATDATASEIANMSDAGTHMSSLFGVQAYKEGGTFKTESVTSKFSGIFGSVGKPGTGESFDNWNKIKWNLNQWHKLDIIVDLDNRETSSDGKWEGRKVYTYVDGVPASGDASTAELVAHNVSGFKGIGVYNEQYSDPGFRYDNIYVSHYTTDKEDSVKILGAETDMSDKKASVAFTEYLNKTPEVSDFVVTNEKGNTVKGYTVSGDARKVTFDFSNATGVPKNGKMTISAKNTLAGIVSNANVTGQVELTTSGTEVLYSETFSNWDASTWNDKTAAPGMVLANLDFTGATNTVMSNIKPYSDEDGNKSALMWNPINNGASNQSGVAYEKRSGAFDIIPFNKVINDGKIYASMDIFIPEYKWNNDENRYYNESDLTGNTDNDNNLKSNGSLAISLFNTSTVDYTDATGTYKATGEDLNSFIATATEAAHFDTDTYVSNHQSQLALLTFPFNESGAMVSTGGFMRIERNANRDGAASNAYSKYVLPKGEWHKLQVIVDCDTTVKNTDGMWEGNPVKVYVDGKEYGNNSSTANFVSDNVSGYKGIGLYRKGYARAGVRFDNIYVSHYTTDKEDSVKLLNAENDFSDKKVSVAFTEYLNKTPEASDFEVKTNVGTPIEDYTVSGDARKVTFDFTGATNLPIDGKVIIGAKETLTGKLSGIGVSGTMEIPFGFSGTNVFEKQDDDGEWFAATTFANGDKIRAHVSVTNGYSEPKSMAYIIAKYAVDEDGTLALSEIVKSESVSCAANETKDLTTEITPTSGAVYKAFVWNSDGYRPFMEYASIQ